MILILGTDSPGLCPASSYSHNDNIFLSRGPGMVAFLWEDSSLHLQITIKYSAVQRIYYKGKVDPRI